MKLTIIFVTVCLLGTLVYLFSKNTLSTTNTDPSSASPTSVANNPTLEEQPRDADNQANVQSKEEGNFTEVKTTIGDVVVTHKEFDGFPVAFSRGNSSLHPALAVYYTHITLLSEGKTKEASVYTTNPGIFEQKMAAYKERVGEAGFKGQFNKLLEPNAANASGVFVVDNVAFVVIEFDGIFGANPMVLKNGTYQLAQDEAELSETQKAFLEYLLEKANS